MKKFFNLSLAALVVTVFIFSACSKGTTGPQGPKGPAGPDSVLTSGWTPFNMSDSVFGTAVGDTVFTQIFAAPAITQSILDSGVIIYYLGFTDNNENENVQNLDLYASADALLGFIYVIAPFDLSGAAFRYVVIPGNLVAEISSNTGVTRQQMEKMTPDQINKLSQQAQEQTGN